MNPHILNLHLEAFNQQNIIKDRENWMLGLYFAHSISSTIGKGKYPEKPIFYEENRSQEEIEKDEIKQAILNEEKWIQNANLRGLPTIKLKRQESDGSAD